ncbi:hypothetical protein I4U23_006314 [Adineta vaga]|nr:hypothetical protein I4U23_006314 [Adineta vaga]
MANKKIDKVLKKSHEFNPSPGKILLPSTIGIPPTNGSPESRLRDLRIHWAPAISISGKTNQPLVTPQYERKEQRIAEKSEQVKFNPKIATNADLSYLTRNGSDRTKLPISFLPHKINPSKIPLSISQRSIEMNRFLMYKYFIFSAEPGPTTYQQYKNYDRIGEEYIYRRQPHVRLHPLIGSTLKRERHEADTSEKKRNLSDMKSFWSTIGTRTYDSRLPTAPVSTIHHRLNLISNKSPGIALPGPAMYPIINTKNDGKDTCTARGVTIAPRYREKQLALSGPGPAMIERGTLDKGYENLLRKAPAFSISSRWSPYSHTYTDECSENFF